MAEEPLAKARAQLATEGGKQLDREAVADHRQQEPGAGQQHQHRHRWPAAGVANHLVDHQLQQHRDAHHQQRIGQHREDRQDRLQPLIAEVAPQS